MIKKIALSMVFLCLCIAIPLAMLGYRRVEIGASGMQLIRMTSAQLQDFKIAIPSIPRIPRFDVSGQWWQVLNFLIDVVNGLTSLINFIITVFNVIIELLEFIFLIVKNSIQFKDMLSSANSSAISSI